jgi:DNA-binding transcriptional regulator YhcF (GntR family)
MTNRRLYHRERSDQKGRYVRLMEYMLASAAWQSLDSVARSLYVEIVRRYRGPNSNNGKIPYSVREAATALNVGRSTANRAFHHLIERGFIVVNKRSGFSMKGRVSTEWLLTEFPDDTQAGVGQIATKDFMKWTTAISCLGPTKEPLNSFHGPSGDTYSTTSEPPMALRRDRVA